MARHHHRDKGDPPVEVTLPITPMLDMSFQLLAFFVMTFQSANALEGQLDMYLPKSGTPQAKGGMAFESRILVAICSLRSTTSDA